MSLPSEFESRLEEILPDDVLAEVVAAFSAPFATAFRVNSLREGDRDRVVADLEVLGLTPVQVPGVPGALRVPPEQREALLASPAASRSAIYIQNASSQLAAILLDPQQGERILDLCAAPGSKTSLIAALTHNEAELTAVEKVRGRYFKLRANLAALGVENTRFHCTDGSHFWRRGTEAYDRVLVDAPCSSEGRFKTDVEASTSYWSTRKIKEMQHKQGKLLFSAIQALKPGGTLIYSTCTFAPEENEGTLNKALRTFGDAITLEPMDISQELPTTAALTEWRGRAFHPSVGNAVRVLPRPEDGIEAFFVARVEKHRSTIRPSR